MEQTRIPRSRFRFPFLRTLVFIIIPTLLVCMSILELGLRATGRLPSNTTDGFFEQHGRSYRLKKNYSKTRKVPSYSFTLHTNSYGFRDKKTGPREIGQKPYIVFLGDSMTFANGVEYEDSFIGVVAERLANDGLEVANLAVGGHFLKEQIEILRDFSVQVTRQPIIVVVCCCPPLIQGYDRSYSNILVKNGYLFRKDGWVLPYLRVILGNVSASYCYFRDNIRKIQAMMTKDRTKNLRGQLAIFAKDNPFSALPVQEGFHATLQGIDRFVQSLGAIPIYVYLPASPDLKLPAYLSKSGEPQDQYDFLFLDKLLQAHCATDQIPFIDLYPVLKKHEDSGEVLSFVLDSHYNATANRVIGEALYQALLESGQLVKRLQGRGN